MMEQIRREIGRALAGVRGAFRAGQIGMQIATRIQRMEAEGLAGEALSDVELVQQFGFTSAPPDGSLLIVLPLGGRTSASVVVATEHGAYRFRVDNQGESALYSQWGDVVHLRKDRSIRVAAALKVVIDSPLAEFAGDVAVVGNLTAQGTVTGVVDVVGGGKSLKTHPQDGVQPGSGTSGGPV
jgi:phage baseplate assembly protein V